MTSERSRTFRRVYEAILDASEVGTAKELGNLVADVTEIVLIGKVAGKTRKEMLDALDMLEAEERARLGALP